MTQFKGSIANFEEAIHQMKEYVAGLGGEARALHEVEAGLLAFALVGVQ